MRSLAVFTFAIVMTVGGILSAQQPAAQPVAKPPAKTPVKAKSATPAAKPAATEAEPEKKKKGFFKRLFTGKDEEVVPAPAPAPKPKPKRKTPARPPTDVTAPVVDATTAPAAEKKPEPADAAVSIPPSSEPQTESKPSDEPPKVEGGVPAAVETKGEPAATGKKGAKNTTKGKKEPAAKTVAVTENMDEAARQAAFKTLKAQALEDEEIKALKQKADTAVSEADSREAAIAYNRALFRKIRQLEPKLNDYTERVEASLMKMLKAD